MNRAVPDEIVEQIRARADIVELVQSYIPLKKAGQTWKACCPFHQEKTPSFTVNPARQTFHCFGCGKGGDVFRFVMERENIDFPNAIHILARKFGVYIPEPDERRRRGDAPLKPEERPDFKERLYSLHEKIQAWFEGNLLSNPSSQVGAYFATRGIPEESQRKFGLGASLDSWDAGAVWARREGFTDAELVAGGLLVESSEHPGRFYDRFRNRLMFPIWNEQGRVVGFSARTVESSPQGGKYVNSPETPIFKKSRILYGLHFARNSIAKDGCAILCEGQLDVIAMHRAGFGNAVAPQGTAFTEEQASMLGRYTRKLLLALDSDAAGLKAVLRCAEIALPAGFEVKVVCFPSGKDPDELLKTGGPELVAGAVSAACDFFEFLLRRLSEANDKASPAGRAAIASEALRYIALMDHDVSKAAYLSWLSSELSLDLAALQAELRRIESAPKRSFMHSLAEAAVKSQPPAGTQEAGNPVDPQLRKALCELLECMLQDGSTAARMAGEDIAPEIFQGDPVGKAVEIVIQAKINGEWEDSPRRILEMLREQPDCPELTALLATEPPQRSRRFLDKTVDGVLTKLRNAELKGEEERLKREHAAAEQGPERDAKALELTALHRKRLALNVRRRPQAQSAPPPAVQSAPSQDDPSSSDDPFDS